MVSFSTLLVRSAQPSPLRAFDSKLSVTASRIMNTYRSSRTWGKEPLRLPSSNRLPQAGPTGPTTPTHWKVHDCNYGKSSISLPHRGIGGCRFFRRSGALRAGPPESWVNAEFPNVRQTRAPASRNLRTQPPCTLDSDYNPV